jgi:hypothetical protein
MRNRNDLDTMMPSLMALDHRQIASPMMPIHVFVQEAENLDTWMRPDLPRLAAVGIGDDVLQGLQARIGALREAQSTWKARRHSKDQAQAAYEEHSAAAFEVLEDTIHHIRFAFRRRLDLLSRTPNPNELATDTQRFQAMNDLAVLGREHPDLLETAGFELCRLDELAALSDDIANLFSLAEEARRAGSGAKAVRDRAYTFLKMALDEIREAARFLFRRNPERLDGYRSEYFRRKNAVHGPAQQDAGGDDWEEVVDADAPAAPAGDGETVAA